MKKRILALLLAVCLLAAVLPMEVSAASSGSCGDNVKWAFNASTGTLTLSGTGETDSYDRGRTQPWSAYISKITTVKVGSGVTVLGYDIFRDHTALAKLELSEGLREICSGAFRGCTALTEVILPDSLGYLGGAAFSGSGLETIAIGGSLEYMGCAFTNCPNLQIVMFLGDAPEDMDDEVFQGCVIYALYPDGNKTWNENTMRQFGGTVAWMRYDPETGEILPDEVYWSFDEATGTLYIEGNGPCPGFLQDEQPWYELREKILHVVVGEGITEIGNKAFYSRFNNLQTLTLPSTLMYIGNQAFYGCANLQNVTFPAGLKGIGFSAFGDCLSMTQVILPDSVMVIGSGAFFRCTELTDLTLPAGLVTLGDSAFEECRKLANVTMPQMPNLTEIGEGVFYLCDGLTNLDFYTADTIQDSMFSHCQGLTEVTIPDCVTVIGERALWHCDSMTKITLSSQLKRLDDHALYGCDMLEEVIFTGNAPMIGEKALGNMTLTCYYPENAANWTEEVLQNYGGSITWIPYNTGTGIPEPEPDITGMCGDNVMWGFLERTGKLTLSGIGSTYDYRDGGPTEWKEFRNRIRSIEVKPGVTGLGTSIFDRCVNVEAVTLHEGLKTIGMFAFWHCDSLTELVVPESVTHIEPAAFRDCPSLVSVKLPSHMTRIPDTSFRGTGMTSYTVPSHITEIGSSVFSHTDFLKRVVIHDGVTKIGDHAFAFASALEEVTWPSSAKTIEVATFYECGLTTFVIPATVTAVEDYGFYNCYDLEKLYVLGDLKSIGEDVFTDCSKLTIYGRSGTNVEKYAKQNGIPFVVIDPVRDFLDVPAGSFYEEPVRWAVEKSITNGIADFTFGPTQVCNRAQVVTFLWRAAGEPNPTITDNPFTDVAKGSFYEKAVLWTVENGITNGADATHFNPNGVCNRAQVVTFLYRTFGNPAVDSTVNPFTDVPADAFYAAPVLWAVENGITNGLSATEFGPNADCNRAQIVTFLYRAYN